MRKFHSVAAVLCLVSMTATAHAQNPEDEEIPDENPPPAVLPAQPPVPAQPEQPQNPAPNTSQPNAPPQVAPPAQPANNADTVTIPRAVWEQLQRDVAELKASRAAPTAPNTPMNENPDAVSTGSGAEPSGGEATDNSQGNRNYLLLPDISFNVQAKGRYSSDKRDEDRRRLSLSEAELAIQGYVYPNVRAEAFIVAEPGEDVPFGLEQGFLDFLGIRKNLSIRVGRDFTPFGRTGRQHTHSWLYTRQLIPIRNIVAEEELGGDGVSFSYLLPTKGKLFANATFGVYNGLSGGAVTSSNPFGQDLPIGTGAGYNDRFYLGRLLLAHPIGQNGELELGGSYTRGRSTLNDDSGVNLGNGRVDLLGLDVSYRRFFNGNKRLLLRSEYFRNKPSGGLTTRTASGYYGLANMRLNKFADVGLLYESSGFPQAPGAREKALSLIYTKQLTEQFYVRLQGTRGDRPGQGNYNEATLQFTWGLGPHTHSLD